MCPNSTEMQIKTIASQWLAQAKVRRIRGTKKLIMKLMRTMTVKINK